MKVWIGDPPKKCDLCNEDLTDKFIDGKLVNGSWGILCPDCFDDAGVGLGLGNGQLYHKYISGDGSTQWRKIAG